MYAIDEVAQKAEEFRAAVRDRQAFQPLYVKIKVIYGCNLKCEMCNHWRAPGEMPMSMDRYGEVIDELASLGCRKVHFSGGEPLLRPQTADLIARATERDIRVSMTTNATLIDKAMAKRLVENGLRTVNVSLDSPDRKVHDRIRGMEGAWKKTVKAVGLLHRYAAKGKIQIRINTVVSRNNYETLAPLPDLAQSLGAQAINLIPVDDHCGEHLSLSRGHIEDYNSRIAPHIAGRALALGLIRNELEAYPFGRSEKEVKLARRGEYALGWYDRHPCFAPWTHSLIDYNGFVYICCMTREKIEPLGDLKTSSFESIWKGAGYQEIRRRMHPPDLPQCRRCDDFLLENYRLFEIARPAGKTTAAD